MAFNHRLATGEILCQTLVCVAILNEGKILMVRQTYQVNRFSAMIGTGSYVPPNVLTNIDLERMVGTNDDWIRRRTGIIERRIADKNTASSDLGICAARKAIEKAEIHPLDIDAVVVATVTPDMVFPSTACFIQSALGAKNACAFDMLAACSGFTYAASIADGLIKSGIYNTVLVVATDVFSKITDWTDRSTCVLFGDAAGAAVLQATSENKGILASYLGADGDYADTNFLAVPAGGSRYPASHKTIKKRMHYIKMNGREVFKLGIKMMAESALRSLELAQLTIEDVDLFIPHQANIRMIEAVGEKLGIPSEKLYLTLQKYGNTSGATTIVALDEAIREGVVREGNIVLMATFGGGSTWGGTVVKL